MDKQRLLHISFKIDVTNLNAGQINAIQDLWTATLNPCGVAPHFEIKEIDPMARVYSMLRVVPLEQAGGDTSVSDNELPDFSQDEP